MMTRMRHAVAGLGALLSAVAGSAAAQDPGEIERLRAQIAALRTELGSFQDQLDSQMTVLRDSLRLERMGTNRFVVTGYGKTGYRYTVDGASVFSSELAPILLWQLTDRVLFSAETEFEMGEELEVAVEYANVSVLATDWLSVGAGKFLTPFTIFGPRLHPAWINKMPDSPLTFGHGGLVPGSGVGVYARGAVPVGSARASYALYAMNAPLLITDGHHAGEIEATDESEERAYGGRFGFLALRSGLELGYSVLLSSENDVTMHGVDLSLTRHFPTVGNIDARFEGAISNATDGPFFEEMDGGMIDTTYFEDNRRVGGYGQLAYRPSIARSPILRNLEMVGRYDWSNAPDWQGGEVGNDRTRVTMGFNYLVTPSLLFKLAWQRVNNSERADVTNYLFQVATGF